MSHRQAVVGLCAVFDVPVNDLDDDSIDVIAIRIIAELGDNPTAVEVGKIVDQVRHAERAAGVEPSSVVPAPAALDIPLGQRAMDAAVAGFDEVAQRRDLTREERRLHLHPACKAAWADGRAESMCSACLYIYCDDDDCDHESCGRERGWDTYFGGEA